MASHSDDERELWEKLLDPIREMYGDDPHSDLELLRRVVHDVQAMACENEKLSRVVNEQARILTKNGWGGY